MHYLLSFLLTFTIPHQQVTQQQTPQSSITAIIDKQLAAYNAHDIEAFLSFYHKDATTNVFPNMPLDKGIDAIRKGYSRMFQTSPKLKAEIVNRIVQGNVVIDQEKVTGFRETDTEPMIATAIYKVENGLITQVWFINSK